jgi:hypothetical protein
MGGQPQKITGIYEIRDKSWRICGDADGKERPKQFNTAGKPSYRLMTLEKK